MFSVCIAMSHCIVVQYVVLNDSCLIENKENRKTSTFYDGSAVGQYSHLSLSLSGHFTSISPVGLQPCSLNCNFVVSVLTNPKSQAAALLLDKQYTRCT